MLGNACRKTHIIILYSIFYFYKSINNIYNIIILPELFKNAYYRLVFLFCY